ncbi:ATP-binding protein [Streptomyces albireticuli]|uniref:ATP-binding protein n=1 Tax=Streptomyces albireticuli TaxID=1940 RepID=UPI00368E1B77
MSTATLATPTASQDARTYHLTAPADPTTARLARQFVTTALRSTGHPGLVENACVCVSDLVANVVGHARVPDLGVEVSVRRERAVVGVRDGDPGRLPWSRRPGVDEEGGRGLVLVRGLSHAAGVTWVWDGLDLVGKEVWFELRDR